MNNSSAALDKWAVYNQTVAFEAVLALIIPTIYAGVILVGVTGNVLVLFVIGLNPNMRNSTNTLILNLALSDLLFLTICVPFTAADYTFSYWPFATWWCGALNYLQFVAAYASVWTLVLMAMDRFLAVVFPVVSLNWRSARNTAAIISLLWLAIAAICTPVIFQYSIYSYPYFGENRSSCIYYYEVFKLGTQLEIKSFYMSFNLFGYILPLGIASGLYCIFLRKLWSMAKPGNVSSRRAARQESIRAKKKVTLLLFNSLLFGYILPLGIASGLYCIFLRKLWSTAKPGNVSSRRAARQESIRAKKKVTLLLFNSLLFGYILPLGIASGLYCIFLRKLWSMAKPGNVSSRRAARQESIRAKKKVTLLLFNSLLFGYILPLGIASGLYCIFLRKLWSMAKPGNVSSRRAARQESIRAKKKVTLLLFNSLLFGYILPLGIASGLYCIFLRKLWSMAKPGNVSFRRAARQESIRAKKKVTLLLFNSLLFGYILPLGIASGLYCIFLRKLWSMAKPGNVSSRRAARQESIRAKKKVTLLLFNSLLFGYILPLGIASGLYCIFLRKLWSMAKPGNVSFRRAARQESIRAKKKVTLLLFNSLLFGYILPLGIASGLYCIFLRKLWSMAKPGNVSSRRAARQESIRAKKKVTLLLFNSLLFGYILPLGIASGLYCIFLRKLWSMAKPGNVSSRRAARQESIRAKKKVTLLLFNSFLFGYILPLGIASGLYCIFLRKLWSMAKPGNVSSRRATRQESIRAKKKVTLLLFNSLLFGYILPLGIASGLYCIFLRKLWSMAKPGNVSFRRAARQESIRAKKKVTLLLFNSLLFGYILPLGIASGLYCIFLRKLWSMAKPGNVSSRRAARQESIRAKKKVTLLLFNSFLFGYILPLGIASGLYCIFLRKLWSMAKPGNVSSRRAARQESIRAKKKVTLLLFNSLLFGYILPLGIASGLYCIFLRKLWSMAKPGNVSFRRAARQESIRAKKKVTLLLFNSLLFGYILPLGIASGLYCIFLRKLWSMAKPGNVSSRRAARQDSIRAKKKVTLLLFNSFLFGYILPLGIASGLYCIFLRKLWSMAKPGNVSSRRAARQESIRAKKKVTLLLFNSLLFGYILPLGIASGLYCIFLQKLWSMAKPGNVSVRRVSVRRAARQKSIRAKKKVTLLLFNSLLFGYILPLGIASGLYCIFLRKLWSMAKPGNVSSRRAARQESIRAKKKVTYMISGVIVTFAICWLPINVCFFITAIHYPKQWFNTRERVIFQIFAQAFAYANSCLNPILYAFLSENFRRGFLRVIAVLCVSVGFRTKDSFRKSSRRRTPADGGSFYHTTVPSSKVSNALSTNLLSVRSPTLQSNGLVHKGSGGRVVSALPARLLSGASSLSMERVGGASHSLVHQSSTPLLPSPPFLPLSLDDETEIHV